MLGIERAMRHDDRQTIDTDKSLPLASEPNEKPQFVAKTARLSLVLVGFFFFCWVFNSLDKSRPCTTFCSVWLILVATDDSQRILYSLDGRRHHLMIRYLSLLSSLSFIEILFASGIFSVALRSYQLRETGASQVPYEVLFFGVSYVSSVQVFDSD